MVCSPRHINQSRLDLLDSLPKGGVCAELGVLNGEFSDEILRRTKPKRLYLVDLFQGVARSGDCNGENPIAVDMGQMRLELEVRFLDMPVSVVKADSVSWLAEQKPESLDWIYIDTTHEFMHTQWELVGADRAVKKGGWICGHDYSAAFPGVLQAVDFYTLFMGMPLTVWEGDKLPSFSILKKSPLQELLEYGRHSR